MGIKDLGFSGTVDKLMQKYGIPQWLKPYIYSYIKRNPVNAIKRATSFIDIRRKKGEITKDYVKLPNGMTFKMEFISHILNLFYYGETRLESIYAAWSKEQLLASPEYRKRFAELSALSKRHSRAIRNLMEGLGIKIEPVKKSVSDVFDHFESVKGQDDRLIISGIVLKYAYSFPFGFVFYRAFYPVSSEFMRSFGKAFTANTELSNWLTEEAKSICIRSADRAHVLSIITETLRMTSSSIDAELPVAKKSGIADEMLLLRDVSLSLIHI